MWKKRAFLLFLLAAGGCQTHKAQVLSPEAFRKHFSASQPAASTNETDAADAKPRLIAPGMQLTIMVEQDRSLNRQAVVPPSGVIDFPGAGRFTVTGLTAEELAQKIREPLERDFFKTATVSVTIETTPTVTAVSSGTINITGAINRPGPMLLPPPPEVFTVTRAILAAGGMGQFGDGSAVRVFRYDKTGKKIETRVNVNRIMKNGEIERDVPLQDGDWLVVPEKWISF
jgi:protein involved in polysaccharide export with SLBB domain